MKIFIERENRKLSMEFKGKASRLLKRLKLNPATVLVARNNSLVAEDGLLSDNDEIKILSVISGG